MLRSLWPLPARTHLVRLTLKSPRLVLERLVGKRSNRSRTIRFRLPFTFHEVLLRNGSVRSRSKRSAGVWAIRLIMFWTSIFIIVILFKGRIERWRESKKTINAKYRTEREIRIQ